MTRLESARHRAGVFLSGACCLAGILASGCALIIPQTEEMRLARPAGLVPVAELAGVPFFPQKDYECGPAALATSLAYFGAPVTADDLVPQVYLPARQGSLQIEMLASARRNGMVAYALAPRFEDLLREIAAGFPVILLQDYGVWPVRLWHYAVAVGYDMNEGELVLRSGEKRRLQIPFAVLEYTWKESDYWAMVTAPPDRIPVTATEAPYLKAVVALEHSGNRRAAREAYAAMLARWPESLGAGIGLANMHYGLGDLEQAEAVLRRLAERHPDAAVVYNNLAQTILDRGRAAEALPLAERAVALGGPYADAARETLAAVARRMREGAAAPVPGR
jgi:tetratricopeptide (TPR) repeat protein